MTATLTKPRQEHAAAFAKIDALDLTMVKMKLCLPVEKEGKGWLEDEANVCETWYKRFLQLNLLYPSDQIVPTKMIDEMWHAHILDTRAYTNDCLAIFGEYLHHFPYLGLRGEQDARNLQAAFDTTVTLFEDHFGESPLAASASCNSGKCSSCGRGCSRK